MKIGPYDVLSEIGRGGAGIVLRARGPDGGERAVKVLKDSSGERLARFQRETRLLSSLGESDGFVPLLDSGESAQGPYIVMPYVPGGTLRDRLRGPLAVAETERIAVEVGAALARAHERGIVHRDLKPENILFAADGRALVADMGLAKHFDREAPGASASVSLSRDGWLRGTMGYMAPEQIKDSKGAGPASDVYALGSILYECLAGVHLIQGNDPRELLARTLEGEHEPIARVRADTPPELARAIERALAPDPAARFPDGAAFLRALSKKEPERRSWAPLVVVVGIGLVAAIGIGAIAARRGPEKTPVATPPAASETPDAERYLALAASELARADDEHALADCDRAVAADPGMAKAYAARAEVKNWKDDFAGAIADATRSIELDPRLAIAFVHRGEAHSLRGEPALAMKDYDHALELDPRCALGLVNRAGARDWDKDFDKAIADLTRAIEIDPGLGKAYGWRAAVLIGHGEYDVAMRDSDKAIELEPRRYPSFWSWRGTAKSWKGDHKGALADIDQAIVLMKKPDSSVYFNRASERFQLEDYRGAETGATQALELDSKNVRALSIRARARHQLGKDTGAREDIDRFLELAANGDPDRLALRMLRATLR